MSNFRSAGRLVVWFRHLAVVSTWVCLGVVQLLPCRISFATQDGPISFRRCVILLLMLINRFLVWIRLFEAGTYA